MNTLDNLILFRGAGELASGAIRRLAVAGMPVIALETAEPLCVRRTVSFASAIYDSEIEIEGIKGKFYEDLDEVADMIIGREMAVLIDPEGSTIQKLSPKVIVDARMLKNNSDTNSNLAPVVIALGPGSAAPKDAHYVIETSRGHDLGRVITNGSALKNTGVPGEVGGETIRRVIRAPVSGKFETTKNLGDMVSALQVVGNINGIEVKTEISGMLRGLIHNGVEISEGTKIGDVDPRGNSDYLHTISDKANAAAGGVMEAVLRSIP